MRIFVTGASGWIGSAVVPELLRAGHQVLGLARSDAAASTVAALGADVRRGDLTDLDSLRAGAAASDGVVHLGYNHDFSRMQAAAQTDLAAIHALGGALEGTDRPFVIASGVLGLIPGQPATDHNARPATDHNARPATDHNARPATEHDVPDPAAHPRVAGVAAALSYGARGVRSSTVRFAPTVHGPGDHGFIAVLAGIAREKGVSAYLGDGGNRWSAVHRLDAANLVRLAVAGAPTGSALHATAEEGVPTRAIAEAIGRGLDLPVTSIPTDRAADHFGWLGRFFGADCSASSTVTRQLLGWQPVHPGLIDDLDAGYYFKP